MADQFPFTSSQGSLYEQHQIRLPDQENLISSSPPKPFGDAASLHSSSQKPKKPPTVTPKRFTKFFTPRNSLSGKIGPQSGSGRQLRDITRNAINRRKAAQLGEVVAQDDYDILSSRPTKRVKQSFDDIASSPPPSSPMRHFQPTTQMPIYEDEVLSSPAMAAMDVDAELPDLFEQLRPFPKPIRRLRQTNPSQRILQRSFGGHDTNSRGWKGADNCADWRSSTASFATLPPDTCAFRGTALPFCVASCNTNSLVAVGDEEGSILLIDTQLGQRFDRPHLRLRIHHNAIMDVAFSSNDYLMATASGDQTARIVDMQHQQIQSILSGHNGSLKQVRFHPDDNRMVSTCGRDGSVQIWDLRCTGVRPVQSLRVDGDGRREPPTIYAKHALSVSVAHRTLYKYDRDALLREKEITNSSASPPASITALAHLPNGRSHMLLTASEASASIKLWDLRQAGRRNHGNAAIPISSTPVPETQNRNFGISSLVLSGDGARMYSVCRDSAVYAYSTNHLILGSAPEMAASSTSSRRAPKEGRQGVGPLYAFRHPSLRVGSFYIKASLRPARGLKEEMLAVGSSDGCAVLLPTDERYLPLYNNRPRVQAPEESDVEEEEDEPELPTLPTMPTASTPAPAPAATTSKASFPTFTNHGTALVRGHTKEVTSLTFTHTGELVTLSDDFRARCWREAPGLAKEFRTVGEFGGKRWARGWADVGADWDEEE